MKKRSPRPEELLGEWGVRDVTPPSQAERADVEADLDLNPLVGKPLRRRLRNFNTEADLPRLGRRAVALHAAAADGRGRDRCISRGFRGLRGASRDPPAWRRIAERWSFFEVNELIDRHNRWYPIEARLPMDPRSRDFVKIGGRPYWRRPLDAAWVLEHFPA